MAVDAGAGERQRPLVSVLPLFATAALRRTASPCAGANVILRGAIKPLRETGW